MTEFKEKIEELQKEQFNIGEKITELQLEHYTGEAEELLGKVMVKEELVQGVTESQNFTRKNSVLFTEQHPEDDSLFYQVTLQENFREDSVIATMSSYSICKFASLVDVIENEDGLYREGSDEEVEKVEKLLDILE